MSRRAVSIAVCAVLAIVLTSVAVFVPVPYIGLAPGSPYNTLGLSPASDDGDARTIEISGTTVYPTEGLLDFTVVSVVGRCERGLSLGAAVQTWFDRDAAVVPKAVVCPADASDEDVQEQVHEEMVQSQNSAITAALAYLKIPQRTTVVVTKVLDGQPAAAALKPRDTLVAIDDTPVDTSEELRAAIGTRRPGQPVRVRYRRDGTEATATLTTVPSTDTPVRPTIGVEVGIETTPPFDITVNTDPVGGPSAGLMLAVGIVELLTPGDLAGGVHVAGTGTINAEGEVGPIGGIQQKLVGAADADAEHFLVPSDNWEQAQRAKPDGLTLHRIATLQDAFAALAEIKAAS